MGQWVNERKYERAIRSQKRKILIDETVGDKDQLQIDQIKLQRLKQEYARFSKGTGLPMQHARMETAGFTYKHGNAAEKAAKTAQLPNAVGEQSPRSKKKVNYAVDWGAVQNESYARKFEGLSGNERANQAVYTRARWTLNNRDGVKTEEIYAVDMRTGIEIARITDQHYPQSVKRTAQFDRALKKAVKSDAEIMLVHNHPAGSPPSIGDLNALLSTPRAHGIVVGHDGSVYRYSSPKEKIPQFEFDIAILKHKSYTYNTAHEKALRDLAEKYGFEFAKL